MEEKDLFKKLNEESEKKIPDVYKKVVTAANEQGLFNQKTAAEEAYSDGETVALGGANRKAIAITTLAATAAVCLAIALPIALSGKFDKGIPPLGDNSLGSDYAVGAVAATKLAEIYLEDDGGEASARKNASTASLVVNPDEWGIERYISEFDNYFYACNSFFGEKPAVVEYVENHDLKYDNSIIITGKFSNGDEARYAMYYSEARVYEDATVSGDEVKYYLEGLLSLNNKDYSIVGERVYTDATKDKEKSVALTAYPINHAANSRVEMSVEYSGSGAVKKYAFNVVKEGETVSESVLTFPETADGDTAYVLEFNGDEGEKGGKFTVNRPQDGWDSFTVGYEIGMLKSQFNVYRTASKLEKVLAPDGLVYTDLGNGTLSISGYDKTKILPAELILPAEFDGKKVVKITSSAFRECVALQRVVVPEGVTSIGGYAFDSCANITEIVLPESLTEIEYGAFGDCTALKSIGLPKNLISLGNQVFYNCRSLEKVVLPDKVETLGREMFMSCDNLKSVTISASVKKIDEGIFCGTAVENLVVDSANQYYYADGGCLLDKATKTVWGGTVGFNIPDDATAIGDYAFYSCTHFTDLVLPANIKEIGSLAFGKSSIRNIEMLGVEKIGGSAFSDSDVTDIRFSDTLTAIDYNALTGCAKLTSLNFPASLKTLGNNVFEGCVSLESITVAAGNTNFRSENNCLIDRNGTVVLGCKTSVIPNDGRIFRIGEMAFADYEFSQIVLPSSLVEIMSFAFADSNLTSITIPDNVEYINEYAFEGCQKLESVTLSQNLNTIGAYAFKDCVALKNIIIPENVEKVSMGAFLDCVNLSTVLFSGNGATIEESAFAFCENLTSVTLPENLTAIPDTLFQYCAQLQSITIPSTVTEIGSQAFYGCYALTEINFDGTVDEWNAIVKGDGWNWDTGEYTVNCSDGNLVKTAY